MVNNLFQFCMYNELSFSFLNGTCGEIHETRVPSLAMLSYQSKASQTDNPVLDVDESINRLSSEMSTLQQRLEYLKQERLEAVNTHWPQSSTPSKSVHYTEESEVSSHEQCNWAGAMAKYPAV